MASTPTESLARRAASRIGTYPAGSPTEQAGLTPEVIGRLTDAISALAPIGAELGEAFVKIVEAIVPFIPDLVELAVAFAELIAPALESTVFQLGLLADAFSWLMDGPLGDHLHRQLDLLTGGLEAVSGALEFLTGGTEDMSEAMGDAKETISRALGAIPRAVKDTFRDARDWLVTAGERIVEGLADGISNMASLPYNALKGVLGGLSRLIPHSPAEEGPFSGQGWTKHSGEAMLRDWAADLDVAAPELQDRLESHLIDLRDTMTSAVARPEPAFAMVGAGIAAGGSARSTVIRVDAYINGQRPSSYPEGSPERVAGDLFDEMVDAWQRGLDIEAEGGDW